MDEADRGGFKWAGCSDDLTLGTEIAKSYLDSREVGHDSKAKINLHNNNVGRMVSGHRQLGHSSTKQGLIVSLAAGCSTYHEETLQVPWCFWKLSTADLLDAGGRI